tara:strand:+ start:641 stop:1408 length:768 start_codon:yes stop_codon:yes gene_type:complete
MATIKFYGNRFDGANEVQDLINHGTGSGLGFFATAGFGYPVPVDETQGSTFVTDQDGANPGQQINNNQYPVGETSEASKVKVNGVSTPKNLSALNNNEATLNIRFEHTSAVRASQPKIIIYDRSSITAHATDVVTYVFEVRKPATTTTANLSHRAKSTNEWTSFDPAVGGSPSALTLTQSPGPSGLNANATDLANSEYQTYITDPTTGLNLNADDYNDADQGSYLRHDWYVALSSSPTTIGEKKNYALYFTVDYI